MRGSGPSWHSTNLSHAAWQSSSISPPPPVVAVVVVDGSVVAVVVVDGSVVAVVVVDGSVVAVVVVDGSAVVAVPLIVPESSVVPLVGFAVVVTSVVPPLVPPVDPSVPLPVDGGLSSPQPSARTSATPHMLRIDQNLMDTKLAHPARTIAARERPQDLRLEGSGPRLVAISWPSAPVRLSYLLR
jgi:hypothetical protein